MSEQESKPARRKAAADASADEPGTVTATFGEEGADPHDAGFAGTMPKDEDHTVAGVTKRAGQ